MYLKSLLLFQIVFPVAILSVSPAEPSSRPPKNKRESVCLGNAVKLYNLTVDFQDKMAASSKHEYFDELINKDGAQLRKIMSELEVKLIVFLAEMESIGGIAPKTENVTNSVEQFSLEVEMEYQAMMKVLKSLFGKFTESNDVLRKAKKGLMADADEFTKLRTKYLDCAPHLVAAGISLTRPHNKIPNAASRFDLSVLLELVKHYKELDVIEDQVTPIMEKYKEVTDIPPDSEDGKLFFSGLNRVEVLETLNIRKLLDSNDNMLRHFEGIVNDAVEKARTEIDDLSKTFDEMQQEVIKHAGEIAEIDERIRNYIKKLNKLLEDANAAAIELAKKNLKQNPATKDEL